MEVLLFGVRVHLGVRVLPEVQVFLGAQEAEAQVPRLPPGS